MEQSLLKRLNNLQGGSDLKDYVIRHIKSNSDGKTNEEIELYINSLYECWVDNNGIYGFATTKKAHKLFDKYYNDIENIRRNNWDDMQIGAFRDTDLKNLFLWFSIIDVVIEIMVELEIS